jgi:hypothetical protein
MRRLLITLCMAALASSALVVGVTLTVGAGTGGDVRSIHGPLCFTDAGEAMPCPTATPTPSQPQP